MATIKVIDNQQVAGVQAPVEQGVAHNVSNIVVSNPLASAVATGLTEYNTAQKASLKSALFNKAVSDKAAKDSATNRAWVSGVEIRNSRERGDITASQANLALSQTHDRLVAQYGAENATHIASVMSSAFKYDPNALKGTEFEKKVEEFTSAGMSHGEAIYNAQKYFIAKNNAEMQDFKNRSMTPEQKAEEKGRADFIKWATSTGYDPKDPKTQTAYIALNRTIENAKKVKAELDTLRNKQSINVDQINAIDVKASTSSINLFNQNTLAYYSNKAQNGQLTDQDKNEITVKYNQFKQQVLQAHTQELYKQVALGNISEKDAQARIDTLTKTLDNNYTVIKDAVTTGDLSKAHSMAEQYALRDEFYSKYPKLASLASIDPRIVSNLVETIKSMHLAHATDVEIKDKINNIYHALDLLRGGGNTAPSMLKTITPENFSNVIDATFKPDTSGNIDTKRVSTLGDNIVNILHGNNEELKQKVTASVLRNQDEFSILAKNSPAFKSAILSRSLNYFETHTEMFNGAKEISYHIDSQNLPVLVVRYKGSGRNGVREVKYDANTVPGRAFLGWYRASYGGEIDAKFKNLLHALGNTNGKTGE